MADLKRVYAAPTEDIALNQRQYSRRMTVNRISKFEGCEAAQPDMVRNLNYNTVKGQIPKKGFALWKLITDLISVFHLFLLHRNPDFAVILFVLCSFRILCLIIVHLHTVSAANSYSFNAGSHSVKIFVFTSCNASGIAPTLGNTAQVSSGIVLVTNPSGTFFPSVYESAIRYSKVSFPIFSSMLIPYSPITVLPLPV